MKKVLFIMLMLSMGLAAQAQDQANGTQDSVQVENKADSMQVENKADSVRVVDMNRTFSVGGNALMLLRSNNASKKDMKPLEWTLKNDRINDTNIVVLEVKNRRTGETEAHQIWSDGVNVTMKITKDGTTMYDVSDDLFSHLRIMKVQLGTVIMFYSELKNQ